MAIFLRDKFSFSLESTVNPTTRNILVKLPSLSGKQIFRSKDTQSECTMMVIRCCRRRLQPAMMPNSFTAPRTKIFESELIELWALNGD